MDFVTRKNGNTPTFLGIPTDYLSPFFFLFSTIVCLLVNEVCGLNNKNLFLDNISATFISSWIKRYFNQNTYFIIHKFLFLAAQVDELSWLYNISEAQRGEIKNLLVGLSVCLSLTLSSTLLSLQWAWPVRFFTPIWAEKMEKICILLGVCV